MPRLLHLLPAFLIIISYLIIFHHTRVTPMSHRDFTRNTPSWKTYTNSEYGFTLKYPPTWEYKIAENLEDCCTRLVFSPLFKPSIAKINESSPSTKYIGIVTITATRSKKDITLDEVLDNEVCFKNNYCTPNNATALTIAGYQAKKLRPIHQVNLKLISLSSNPITY